MIYGAFIQKNGMIHVIRGCQPLAKSKLAFSPIWNPLSPLSACMCLVTSSPQRGACVVSRAGGLGRAFLLHPPPPPPPSNKNVKRVNVLIWWFMVLSYRRMECLLVAANHWLKVNWLFLQSGILCLHCRHVCAWWHHHPKGEPALLVGVGCWGEPFCFTDYNLHNSYHFDCLCISADLLKYISLEREISFYISTDLLIHVGLHAIHWNNMFCLTSSLAWHLVGNYLACHVHMKKSWCVLRNGYFPYDWEQSFWACCVYYFEYSDYMLH